jgi:SAM-dependent methyltransferase
MTKSNDDYVFADEDGSRRSDALSALFDPVTFRHCESLGVARDWRCWEVGAGGLTVVNWLAQRVGPGGRILATDIDTAWVTEKPDPTIEVRRHDVTGDEPPAERFDLIHARHVLLHLPSRHLAIERMIAALQPGGWLLIEDYDQVMPFVCVDACRPEHHRANKVHAGVRALLAEHGLDLDYARTLPRLFREAGLTQVGADAFFAVTAPAANMLALANVTQLRDALIARELATAEEIDTHLQATADQTVSLGTLPLISAWGQRSQWKFQRN